MGCQYFHPASYCPCTLLFSCRICLSCVGKIIPCKESWRLPDSCRCITGCLRPTNVDSLYVLAGIAPPGVRRSVASRTERRRQAEDTRHPCHNHQPAPSRLKSRKSFLHAVQPLSQPPQTARLALWEEQRIAKQHLAKLPIQTSEQLAPGHKSECPSTDSARVWAAAKPTWVNGAMLIEQIQPVNAGPQSRPCSTCWDAHFLKMNAAWKIWQLLMRRLSTVQEPGQTYDSVRIWWTWKKKLTLPKWIRISRIIAYVEGLFKSSLYFLLLFTPLSWIFSSKSYFFSPNRFDLGRVDCTYTQAEWIIFLLFSE